MNYQTLINNIQSNIYNNGNNEITGNLLQQALMSMVNSLGVGYQYAGIATPATNPGTPDQNVFYLASTAGTYTNFGGLVLADGEIAILKYNGTWSKDSTGAASLENVNQLVQEINDLEAAINGKEEVNIIFSDYALEPGLITSDGTKFRSSSIYGTANKYILIPFSDYRGRTMNYVKASGVYASRFAFLASDALVDDAIPPYCQGTTVYNLAADGDYLIPNDCSYLYVYADRQGASSLPASIKIKQVERTVATKDDIDDVLDDLASVAKNTGFINIHSLNNDYNHGYTLANAISSVPSELRYTAKGIVYMTADEGESGVRVALFNSASYMGGWTDVSNWSVFNPQDLQNISNTIGIYKEVHNNVTSPSGNTIFSDIVVPWVAMKVFVNSIDDNGKWRIFARYTDNTNGAFTLSLGENTITPAKPTKGFAFVLGTTSESCDIDADIFIGDALLIYDKIPEYTPPTPESIGAVPVEQGLVNVGKVLVVGSDGNVVPGENTPAGVLEGYAKIETVITLFLKADSASEVSVGTGWSGDLANGYTHTPGNTDSLVLGHTTEDKKYLVTLIFDALSEGTVSVKIGDGYPVDPYNGTTTSRIGFISDGGDLTIIPVSSYSGTIQVTLQEITDESSSVESVTITVANFDEGLMVSNISGFWNVAIGPNRNTMGNIVNASRNIGVGYNALRDFISGMQNIGIGTFALSQLKSGRGNIAIGADTYYKRKGGDDNIIIGRACMGGSTDNVNNNVCIGRSAGEQASGDSNVCVGTLAGYKATTGCVFIGDSTGYNHTGGLNNTFIGRNSGKTGTTKTAGNWNTCIGPGTDFENNISKSCAVGYNARADKSNQVVLGNYSETLGDGTVETKVHGDLVVRGTDGVNRRIVFNQDNSISWEVVS